MPPEDRWNDDDPHAECRFEIARQDAEIARLRGTAWPRDWAQIASGWQGEINGLRAEIDRLREENERLGHDLSALDGPLGLMHVQPRSESTKTIRYKRAEEVRAERDSLRALLGAYRLKRMHDGLNGRVWNSSIHLEADEQINRLEFTITTRLDAEEKGDG